ncbi:MAG: RNA polymerase sigma factor FliA, partial [Campylobacteraceae bacterium]|nr:RNA polymerase sigma factor FliA [Campylobacteraceae bacterium]
MWSSTIKQHNPYVKSIKKEQDDIVIQYLPAVRAMAYRLRERLPTSIDVDDLISIGTEEMIKLSRKYDRAQNDSFWGYAKKRVYGSMLDYLRSLDVVSRNNRRLIKAIDVEISKHLTEEGMEPDDHYLADKLGETHAKIREARAAAEISTSVPLNEQLITKGEQSVEEKVEKDQMIEAVKAIVVDLNQREQTIIQLYYFEELNLK